jgi:hypothetical protein
MNKPRIKRRFGEWFCRWYVPEAFRRPAALFVGSGPTPRAAYEAMCRSIK